MNENSLKRIQNHYSNDPKDQRGSFVQVIEHQIENLNDEEKNNFILKVLPFIKKYSEEKNDDSIIKYSDKYTENSNKTLKKMINEHGVIKKGKVYRDFMKECLSVIIDETTDDTVEEENDTTLTKCPECQSAMAYIVNESSMACMKCGYSFFYQDFSLPYYNSHTSNTGEFVCQFAYKRINHFREWLTQIQGKENTVIPEELVLKILKELKKERIQNVNEITHDKIKKYLKKNGYSKYYEHIPIIITKICKKEKTTISADTERILVEKFGEIQEPFERHRPKGRKNFLSYSYTLHKLCQLIGRNDLLSMFPLLKSRPKLYVQDDIWEKICADLGWNFIPSL